MSDQTGILVNDAHELCRTSSPLPPTYRNRLFDSESPRSRRALDVHHPGIWLYEQSSRTEEIDVMLLTDRNRFMTTPLALTAGWR